MTHFYIRINYPGKILVSKILKYLSIPMNVDKTGNASSSLFSSHPPSPSHNSFRQDKGESGNKDHKSLLAMTISLVEKKDNFLSIIKSCANNPK